MEAPIASSGPGIAAPQSIQSARKRQRVGDLVRSFALASDD